MVSPWVEVMIFLVAGLTFPIVNVAISSLLRRNYPYPEKLVTYESGLEPFGDARVRFRTGYYFFAMEFLIFDVEAVFLFPWIFGLREIGAPALIAMILFIAVLVVGLIYSYQRKVLRWV